MKRLVLSFLLFFALMPAFLYASGASSAASSGERGSYLANQGRIIPESEVYTDSYIAAINYRYPEPEGDLGVFLYTGHSQISAGGQDEIFQIGIQGGRRAFADLPPMNLVFVIDHSGSMGDSVANGVTKLQWVQEAFQIFIERIRPVDFVSVVMFNGQADLVFPSTRMSDQATKDRFRAAVNAIRPDDGTDLASGLMLGYQQALVNFRADYTNRVLFLTDGQGSSSGLYDTARAYRQMGINVSTIGVGTGFDTALMTQLATEGGGSSRFIADRESMLETFGEELDRMVVPAARELSMRLDFLVPVDILETWGYENRISGSSITYALPTLHNRDYETILVRFRLRPGQAPGERPVARFSWSYTTLAGTRVENRSAEARAVFVDSREPVSGYSTGMVLWSGTMLDFASGLKQISRTYYGTENAMMGSSPTTDPMRLQEALQLTLRLKAELENARLRLDDTGFDDEIAILDNYLATLRSGTGITETDYQARVMETALQPVQETRGMMVILSNLLRELSLNLAGEPQGPLAVAGFSSAEHHAGFIELLDELATQQLATGSRYPVVERSRLVAILEEQELQFSNLMDTENAVRIGRILAARYILTGTVIVTPNTVIVFGRIVNVETAQIVSAAQVVLPVTPDLRALL